MSALEIAQVGEQVLKTEAKKVTVFDEALIEFVRDLEACMHEANGIGIAAPQVFDSRAIMIMASRENPRYPEAPDMEPMVLINPKILEQSGEPQKDWEGCLSVPGVRGLVSRNTYVRVSYQTLEGEKREVEWQDFLARVFLHEYDHLIGKTWLDRVDSVSDIVGEAVYTKLVSDEN
jgi:peptide deformylase